MSSASKAKRPKRSCCHNINEIEETENEDFDAIYIPASDNSGDSGSDSDVEEESNLIQEFSNISYRKVSENYEAEQAKLEADYNYSWVSGEQQYNECPENVILLPDHIKKMLSELSSIQLFELFFSKNMKDYIIESTRKNDFCLTSNELDVFLGIKVLSIFNRRESQDDYWSTNQLLECLPVSTAMS